MLRRLDVAAAGLFFASLALGAAGGVGLVRARAAVAAAEAGPPAPAAAQGGPAAVIGPANAARLPADRVLLDAADEAECRGVVVCSHCQWGVGEVCHKNVLWDK